MGRFDVDGSVAAGTVRDNQDCAEQDRAAIDPTRTLKRFVRLAACVRNPSRDSRAAGSPLLGKPTRLPEGSPVRLGR